MTLQKNCDRVKIACLAQLVNVIAPIMTENGGKVWLQTIFYPYMYASKYGRGICLKTVNQCENYQTSDGITVPYVDTSVILNEENRELIVFAVNRSLEEKLELKLNFEGFEMMKKAEHTELYSDDLKAINTKDKKRVVPERTELLLKNSLQHRVTLKKHSWNMFRFDF